MMERRNFVRWQIDRQVSTKLEGAEKPLTLKVNDINLKGARISLRQRLPPDTTVRLNLPLSEGFVLNVDAFIAWHRIVNEENMYGLSFSRIRDNDKEKLFQFVRQEFPREIERHWWQESINIDSPIKGKGGLNMEDRRIFARFAVNLRVRFLAEQEKNEGLAQSKDISAKGLGLFLVNKLANNSSLELWLEIPDKMEPLYMRGKVIWADKVDSSDNYRVGISLEKADFMGLSRLLRVLKVK
ncbi:MAG: PilZ domain-containing protein [Candidatus Omnitrophota bacterium]